MSDKTWKCGVCGATNGDIKTDCYNCGNMRGSIMNGNLKTNANSDVSRSFTPSTAPAKRKNAQGNLALWAALAVGLVIILIFAFSKSNAAQKHNESINSGAVASSPSVQVQAPVASKRREEQLLNQGMRVVASIPEQDLYLCVSSNFDKSASDQVFLIYGDNTQKYYYTVLNKYMDSDIYSTIGTMGLRDLDRDGTNEIVCVLPYGSGTGMKLDELLVFDKDGSGGYIAHALTPETVSAMMEPMCEAGKLDNEYAQVRFKTENGQTFQRIRAVEPSLCLGLSFPNGGSSITMSMYASFVEINPGVYKFSCDINDFYDRNMNWIASNWMSSGNNFTCSLEYDGSSFSIHGLSLDGEPYDVSYLIGQY